MSKSTSSKAFTPSDIYRAYRHTLKSISRERINGEDNRKLGRTGERKQRAREIVSNRYHLSISRVKDIVREQDKDHGIVHDQNSGWLNDALKKSAEPTPSE